MVAIDALRCSIPEPRVLQGRGEHASTNPASALRAGIATGYDPGVTEDNDGTSNNSSPMLTPASSEHDEFWGSGPVGIAGDSAIRMYKVILQGERMVQAITLQYLPADSIDSLILQSIRRGQGGTAIELLERGANPNAKDSYGFALTQAIRQGYEELAVKMLESGAEPNAKDSYGFALTQAIRQGYEELAIKMLECNADPKVKDSYGFALTQAIRQGYEKLAIKILKSGDDLNAKDSYGFALTQARRQGHEELVLKLLKHGTD
jgi:hypothetical protein